jgi:hypothetical protein
MTIAAPPNGLRSEDYEEIEDAVMETARGRWFLLEYARRQRAAETQMLLSAIERLERRIGGAPPAPEQIPMRREGESLAAPNGAAASLSERLHDFAWRLRESGFDDALCLEVSDFAREAARIDAPILLRDEPAIQPTPPSRSAEPTPQATPPRPKPPELKRLAPPAPPMDPRIAALSRLNALALREKIALFA